MMSSNDFKPPLYAHNPGINLPQSLRQSFSGSETDVSNSTSTENLTHEEKHVLRHLTRQEPQGEENTLNNNMFHQQPSPSYNSTSSIPNSSAYVQNYNSLKRYLSDNNKMYEYETNSSSLQPINDVLMYKTRPPAYSFRIMSHESVINSNVNKNVPPLGQAPPVTSTNNQSYHPNKFNQPDATKDEGQQYSQNQCFDISQLPPPPEYPKTVVNNNQNRNETEKLGISEPDSLGKLNSRLEQDSSFDDEASDIVASLSAENTMLKQELGHYYMKVCKLQKVENDVFKVHSAHEDLIKTSDKRVNLEREVRVRLELEIRRLQDVSKRLKDQLDLTLSRFSKEQTSIANESDLKKELNKRDVLVSQLITQNKELISDKERQEVELSAQRATLQEQRNHIDIMDNALTNAQANVVRLEEECRKKHAYVERVTQLQKALTSLQTACDKRDVMEKKLRQKLENEIEALRKRKGGNSSSEEFATKEAEMQKQIREYEEKIIALEAEVFKWEQRYLEENAIRQIAIDNVSMPKDAKIAALEKTSQQSEKLIAEARSEKMKQMDELYQSQKKCADIEIKIKDLESKLAEKEAMIKVLQKQSADKNEAIHNAILSPRHSPHPSILHAASLSSTAPITASDVYSNANKSIFTSAGGSSFCDDSTLKIVSGSTMPIYHKSTPSQNGIGAISSSSSKSQVSDDGANSCMSTPTNCSSSTEKSLDEQLKDVESQLSSKDSIISALRAEKQKYPNHFWRV